MKSMISITKHTSLLRDPCIFWNASASKSENLEELSVLPAQGKSKANKQIKADMDFQGTISEIVFTHSNLMNEVQTGHNFLPMPVTIFSRAAKTQ